MKTTNHKHVALVMVLFGLTVALASVSANATPDPIGVVIYERVFNDCPTSTLTTENMYPALVAIEDEHLDCGGFANLHAWRFSTDNIDAAVFNNNSAYTMCAILTISGEGDGEAGLSVSPWWSPLVDGRFNVRTTDGEVACFGGRLPFYSFTAANGVHYMKGDAIRLSLLYHPHGLSMADPATITYELVYENYSYSSGPLPFDEGNPAEDPPYGLWGMLNDGRVGGYMQAFLQAGNYDAGLRVEWSAICFQNLDAVGTEPATWGNVKAMYK